MHRLNPTYRVSFDQVIPANCLRVRCDQFAAKEGDYLKWKDEIPANMRPISCDTMFCTLDGQVFLAFEFAFPSTEAAVHFKLRWL